MVSSRPGSIAGSTSPSRAGTTGARSATHSKQADSASGTGSGNDGDPTEADLAIGDEELMAGLDFRDLSSHASVFRNRLIEEFQLLENLSMGGAGAVMPPQYNTRDVRDTEMLEKILGDAPDQLIKFQAFKRTRQSNVIDRRLTRIRNKDKVPIGAWASWVVYSNVFQTALLVVIVINAVLVGISAELTDTQESHVELFQTMDVIDKMSLVIFFLEIILKWTDNFKGFWRDGWNCFDFFVTIGTTIPELVEAFGGSSGFASFRVIVRQLRTFRILRALKLAVRFSSLRIIVVTIMEAFRSMALIAILILLFLFIFAVVGVYACSSLSQTNVDSPYKDGFATLGASLQIQFQFLTMDNWSNVLEPMLTVLDPVFAYAYVLLSVWLGAFIFRNVFVGVMVSNFNRISVELQEKQREMIKAKKLDQMRKRLKRELGLAKNALQRPTSNPNVASGDPPAAPPTASGMDVPAKPSTPTTSFSPTTELQRPSSSALRSSPTKSPSPPPTGTAATTATGFPSAFSQHLPPHPTSFTSSALRHRSSRSGSAAAIGGASHQNLGADASSYLNGDEEDDAQLVDKIQQLLMQAHGVSKGWEATIRDTLTALASKTEETLWPRDTLFKYFQLMESLQENMREYQELQMMANSVLLDLQDS